MSPLRSPATVMLSASTFAETFAPCATNSVPLHSIVPLTSPSILRLRLAWNVPSKIEWRSITLYDDSPDAVSELASSTKSVTSLVRTDIAILPGQPAQGAHRAAGIPIRPVRPVKQPHAHAVPRVA